MTAATTTANRGWTCDRCEVAIRYLPGHEPDGPPTGWSVGDDGTHCLRCRRELAAEAAFEEADAGLDLAERAKLRTTGRIEFEVHRAPARTNGEIAKSVGCSVQAVIKARRRLESAGRG
jgi:hypothetical protein